MTTLGPPTYDGQSTDKLEFQRFDELIDWLWGEEAFDPSLDFLLIPTGAAISTQIRLRSLKGIEKFSHLKGLHLGAVGLPNLKGIEDLGSLESLSIQGNNIRSIEPLGALGSLRYLDMAMVPCSDFTPLNQISELTWLLVDEVPIKDLSALVPCSKLRVLRLNYCQKFRDLSPLAELRLRHLDINLCAVNKADFGGFGSLEYLRPNSHKKVVESARSSLGPNVVSTSTEVGTLSDLLLRQGWVKPGEEHLIPACSLGLHNQQVVNSGGLESFTNLRELRVPFMEGDLTELVALRSVESGYATSLKLSQGVRFGATQGVEAPVSLWLHRGGPENYSPRLFPELKWWISPHAMWRMP